MNTPAYTFQLFVAVLLLMATSVSAQTVRWHEDTFKGGTCKKLDAYRVASGVRARDNDDISKPLKYTNVPGKWAVTKSYLFIGNTRADDKNSMDEISFKHSVRKGKRAADGTRQVCIAASGFNFNFRAEHDITAIEWQHGLKPDSKCAKEWARIRAIIRSHEPLHVQDVEVEVAAANVRSTELKAMRICGANEQDAWSRFGNDLLAKVQAKIAKMKTKMDDRASVRDKHIAKINCKLCEENFAFKGVDVFCEIKTPQCVMRMGQKFSGKACGDPLTATWVITPEYYTTGCNMPADPRAKERNKPFDTDCVAAGSAEEKRRAEIYKGARGSAKGGGAGGWFCVYSDKPEPQITIRSFRMAMCQGAQEQSVSVKLESTEACN